MKIQHASVPHLGKEEKSTALPIPVYEVAMAEDEDARFKAQMDFAAQVFDGQQTTGIPLLSEDPIIQQEIKKRSTFERLQFFSKEHTKEVQLGGVAFKIKLLDSNDQAYIVKIMKEYAPTEGYKLSFMTLAASIISINDMPLEDFYDGEAPIKEPVIKKYYQVNKWNTPVTTLLMSTYNSFQREVESGYTKDFLVK